MRTLTDKYINLFTDFGFKKLFGTEFNKPLLVDFLNELIGSEAGRIKDLTFLSTEQLGRSRVDRQARQELARPDHQIATPYSACWSTSTPKATRGF